MSLFAAGTTFHLPDLDRPIPVLVHPDVHEAEKLSDGWVRESMGSAFTAQRDLDCFFKGRGAYWACLGFPTATGRRIVTLCDFAQYLFALDSEFTNAQGGRGELLRSRAAFDRIFTIMDDAATPEHSATVYERAFHDVWTRLTEPMPPRQRERFKNSCRAYLGAHALEVASRERDEVFDFPTYMEVHRRSIATEPYFIQIESGLEIDLSDISDDGQFDAVHRLAADHLVLVNDLFSFPLECAQGDYVNAVAVFHLNEGMTLQAAIDRLCGLINDAEHGFIRERSALLSGPLGRHPGLPEYLHALGHMMSGSLYWSYLTPRYHGPDFVWKNNTTGWVSLHSDHVTFDL